MDQDWVVGFSGNAADAAAIAAILAVAQLPPSRCFSLAGWLTLSQFAHALARTRLLVTIDTGPAHLAAAVGAPVLALHGPTRFERWGAHNPDATGLNAPHPAAGYIHFGFERHRQADRIMSSLTVDTVAAAALSRLGRVEERQEMASPVPA